MRIVFVTGGARSGKSSFAQHLAEQLGGTEVTFIATAEAHDDEMRERVQRHRYERPARWTTLEAPRETARALRTAATNVVLLDCLSLLVSNALLAHEPLLAHEREAAALAEVEALLEVAAARSGHLILVSNEVGSGVVPPYPLGRAFRDALGRANQRAAQAAHEAYLIVAGLPLTLKREAQ